MKNSARSLPLLGLLSILALTLAFQVQAQDLGWGCLQKYTEKFTHKYSPGQYTKTAVDLGFKDEGAGSDAKLLRGGIRPLAKAGVLTGVVEVADAVRTLVLPFEYLGTAFNHQKYGASFELVFNLQILAQAVTGQFGIHDELMNQLATEQGIQALFKAYPKNAEIALFATPSQEQLASFRADPAHRALPAYLHLIQSEPLLEVSRMLAMATNPDGVVDLLMEAYLQKGLLCSGEKGVMRLRDIIEKLATEYPDAM